MKLVALALVLLCGSTTAWSRSISAPSKEGCACVAKPDPVCGIDGKTYSNAGCAGCEGMKVACDGECPCKTGPGTEGCVCTAQYDPVCGIDGKTYSNSCSAGCAGVSTECVGECPCRKAPGKEGGVCTQDALPVCGIDGKTYVNSCYAYRAGIKVACRGECPCGTGPKRCTCGGRPQPVCGSDGETYINRCEARCKKAEIKCYGECPCPDSSSCASEGQPCSGTRFFRSIVVNTGCCKGLRCCTPCSATRLPFNLLRKSTSRAECKSSCPACIG